MNKNNGVNMIENENYTKKNVAKDHTAVIATTRVLDQCIELIIQDGRVMNEDEEVGDELLKNLKTALLLQTNAYQNDSNHPD